MNHPGDTRANAESAAAPTGWRGDARSTRSDGAQHAWQQGGTVQPLTQLRLRDQKRSRRVAGLLLLLFALSAAWVYSLLFKAVQTPMVVVAATEYDWPLPPNEWVREDVDRFGDLHRKTLYVVQATANWNTGENALAELRDTISDAITRHSKSSAVVIYVSMHGVVDEVGNPCLVPPGGAPLDASSWIPVRALLDCIKSLPNRGERDIMLVLDCNRIRANWRIGVLHNAFADRLSDVVLQSEVPNLVVLNSAGPGQIGWSSPALRGSTFGYFLRLALAGEADADENRQITVGELHDYLRSEVDRWAVQNRAARQTPMLIAQEDAETRQKEIAWVPAGDVPLKHQSVGNEVSPRELDELWIAHKQMKDQDAIRFAPLEFQSFQNRLIWLEQLSLAGSAYSKRASELKGELQSWITTWKQRKNDAVRRSPVASRRRIWDPDTDSTDGSLRPHSLPMAMYFGTIDENTTATLRQLWEQPVVGDGVGIEPDAGGGGADESVVASLTESVFRHYSQRQLAWSDGDAYAERLQAYRSVFALLERGEQTAVPDDERAAAWIEGTVAEGDRARRAAEDALLAHDLEQVTEQCRGADEAYERAEKLAESVANAYAVRDRAFAELPYLAKWFTEEPLSGGSEDSSSVSEDSSTTSEFPAGTVTVDRLKELIENLQMLDEQLSDPDKASGYATPDSVSFATTLKSVEEHFDWLREQLSDRAAVLAKARTASPESIRKLQAVLDTPLIVNPQREVLRKKLSAFDKDLFSRWEDAKSEDSESKGTPSEVEPSSLEYLARLEKLELPHPAVQLVCPTWLTDPLTKDAEEKALAKRDSDVSGAAETAVVASDLRLAKDGERIRRCLREWPNIYRGKETVESSDGTPIGNDQGVWEGALANLSCRERLARAAAAWCARPLNLDPIAIRRRFDLQGLLLWHAERTLQDFRGPANGQGESFFRTAAQDYLEAVSQYGAPVDAIAQRREMLRGRLDTARFGLGLDVENVLLVDPSDLVQTLVRLRPDDTRSDVKLGRGRLTLFARSAGQRVADVNFTTLPEAEDDNFTEGGSSDNQLAYPLVGNQRVRLEGDGLALRGSRLDVVVAFRGHELAVPCLLQTIGGVTVDYRPSTNPTTRILVKGTRRQRKSFVFVLDCSDSMKQGTDVEATDGQRMLRLELAKNALQGMLEQLADEPDTRVGVRFFGHRVGWSTTEPVRILRRKDYARPIPLDLSPSDDVEQILPLGRFDSLVAGQVEDLLASVQPWGQTPLYRALVDAIDDFDQDDPDTEKHVVVITDGVNYQFSPSASGRFAAPNPAIIDDVVAAWAKQKPAIHLVGFRIPDQEIAAAEREYGDLINRTSGDYDTDVDNAQTLLDKLDQWLPEAMYEVQDASDKSVGVPIEGDGSLSRPSGPARLSRPLVIQPPPDKPGEYTVVCQQLRESILLRGGEAVEFELSADGRRLASRDYLAGAPQFGALLAGANGPSVGDEFGVHRPIIENGGARFEFSIQHPRQRFTPRPAEIWIDVTSLDTADESASSTYMFYDAAFAVDAPVPVIRWLAKGWPGGADAARVGCWYKMKPTSPDVTIDVSDISVTPADREAIDEFPDVEFQLELISSVGNPQVRVVEWHGETSAGVGALKVDLAPSAESAARPLRVIRTFDPEKNVAAHVFTLPGSGVEALLGWEIRLTSAQRLRDGAIQLDEPIEVSLANADQLPPLTSANGR